MAEPAPATKTADRAVSDVVGFVLVASLILIVVGVVSVGGMGALQDARANEQVNNAERAFEVFAANVEDVARGGAPSRSTEIRLADATLGFGEPVRFNVSFAASNQSFSASIRPIVYDTGGAEIHYVNGALVRSQEEGAVMLRQPGFTFGNRTVIPYVVTRAVDGSSVSGTGRVLLNTNAARRTVTSYAAPPAGGYNATLNVTSANPGAWQRALGTREELDCTRVGSTVSCEFDASRVYIQVVRIDLDVR